MGKRSQKNSLYREKRQSGCMSGLISIFDFRQGRSSQKLLPDRRHGSIRHTVGTGYSKNRLKLLSDVDGKCEGKNDADDDKTSKIDIGQRSVKKLMEEEMFSEQQPKKKIGAAAVESQEPEYSHLDLVALMEEFCSHVHQRLHHENKGDSFDGQESISSVNPDQLDELDLQLVRKHTILEEKLSEAAEAFLNQKFIDAKQSTDGAVHQTQQFMDALDILNSNKDLLLKLLEDSNSLLVKHIQDLRDAQSEKGEPKQSLARTNLSEEEIVSSTQCQELIVRKQIQKQNMYNFFWRKAKSQSKNSSKDSDSPLASNRIVVLKPNPTSIQNPAAATSPRSSTQYHYSLSNQGQGGRFNSKFSIREIKKKLKRVMGESKNEQHRISMDAILHKIPFESPDSVHCSKGIAGEIKELTRKIHSRSEKAAKPTNCDPVNGHEDTSLRDDTCKNLTMEAPGYPKQRESNIYLEAKKHLSNMLSTREEDLCLSTSKVPKSLGKTLSLPEYISSPILSPRDNEHTFVTAQMRFSFSDNFGIVSENIWQPVKENLTPSKQNSEIELQTDEEIKLQVLDLNPDFSRELIPETIVQESILACKGDLSPKGGVETVETTESVCTEKSNFVDDPSGKNCSTPTTRSNPSTETLKDGEEEGSSKCLMDTNRKNEPSLSSLGSFSSNCLLDQKVEALESINDGPEWESPVSVLKPFFLEDVPSPATPMSDPAELKIQPVRIRFEEHDATVVVVTPLDPEIYLTTCMEDKKPTFEYVRAVLRASGLSWDEFKTNYCSSNQLLDPSLFDEVEVSSSRLCGDPELIFDCINEVLMEVYERYFGCPPWVKFIKSNIRPVPVGNSIIQEVWECIDWHLIPQLQPCTLDHIIGKDMTKEGTWVNLQFDIEEIGIQISEAILIELMEDTICNLCS